MNDLATALTPSDFYRPAHTVLWQALCDMHAAGTPTDPITVTAHLAETGQLATMGGAPYLHTLTRDVPFAGNAGHYADIVTGHAKRRQVAALGTRLTAMAASGADVAA